MPLSHLSDAGVRALAEAIAAVDPDGEFVKLDAEARQVWYSPRIKQHEVIRDYVGEEEPVRAYLIAWLCTTGVYPPEALELERSYEYGRSGQAQLDVRISEPDSPDRAFALIEVKAPGMWGGPEDPQIRGQLFALTAADPDTKVLSLVTVQVGSETPTLTTVTIDYTSGLTYNRWVREGRPSIQDFPVNYQEPTEVPYAPGTDRDLRTDITRPQLDRIRRELHNKLWGGSRDDNQIYAWLVRLFLTKIHDEKVTDERAPYRFQVFHEGTTKETPLTTLNRISECYEEAYHRYVDIDAEDVDPLDETLFSADEVQWVVETLQDISITSAGRASGDLLGAFFEAITRDGFKQSKGLFFTHYNLAVFMLEVLEIEELAEQKLRSHAHPNDRLPYIIDPACGSGTFLLAAMRLVTQHVTTNRTRLSSNRDVREQLTSKFPKVSPNEWAREFIYGIEKREDLAISTKVNMVLHQDGHTHIYHDDGLAPLDRLAAKHHEQKFRTGNDSDNAYERGIAETFDVVVTNPPFSITLDGSVRERLTDNFILANDRNSENLFLERWYQLLKHGGRLAAVLPESFFSTGKNISARIFLLLHFDFRAIVTLPVHAFQPWTPTRTSLLFAQKKTAHDEKKWVDKFQGYRDTAVAAKVSGLAAARKIMAPGVRTTAQQIAGHVETAKTATRQLGLLLPGGRLSDVDWATAVHEAISGVDPDVFAFDATVRDLGGTDYLGVIVSEVGYRRTRRAENSVRNDLFYAVTDAATEPEQLRNLNYAKDGWRVVVADDHKNALSILRSASLWI